MPKIKNRAVGRQLPSEDNAISTQEEVVLLSKLQLTSEEIDVTQTMNFLQTKDLDAWKKITKNIHRINYNKRNVFSDSNYHIIPAILQLSSDIYSIEIFYRKNVQRLPGVEIPKTFFKLLVYTGQNPNEERDFLFIVKDIEGTAISEIKHSGELQNIKIGLNLLLELFQHDGLIDMEK